MKRFSWRRLAAVILKEFIQLRRDRLTFAMMVGIPLLQLTLFGFAINSDPKSLPTLVVAQEQTVFTRSLVRALENSGYFRIVATTSEPREADMALAEGEVQFAVTVPAHFARDLQRGDRPQLLVEADASDPAATGNAIAALQGLVDTAPAHDLVGPLARLQPGESPFELVIQRRYNPEGITISSVARNQMQAMQLTFFFLPSMLLSGFMFPFRGMPRWAQWIGEVLPLTHFLRIVRGVMLKGNGLAEIAPHLWPLLLFMGVVLGVGLKRFRKTLD